MKLMFLHIITNFKTNHLLSLKFPYIIEIKFSSFAAINFTTLIRPSAINFKMPLKTSATLPKYPIPRIVYFIVVEEVIPPTYIERVLYIRIRFIESVRGS